MSSECRSRDRLDQGPAATVSWVDPRTGRASHVQVCGPTSVDATADAIAVAASAAPALAAMSPEDRAGLLAAVADGLDQERSSLVALADEETALGPDRLNGELTRTIHQLRFLGDLATEGSYLDATIDTAQEQTPLGAVPDLRRAGRALGPVAVFAASNFPFAFSVVGGDTASALAAGCPVMVKAHPGHPRLSDATLDVSLRALAGAGAPAGTLALAHGRESGTSLVTSPSIRAVGFTGSFAGGTALWNLANRRPEPIPFFGELGSLNPVVVSREALDLRGPDIAREFVASLSMGAGQFCTSPGLLFVPSGGELDGPLREALSSVPPGMLLTRDIYDALASGMDRLERLTGVTALAGAGEAGDGLSVSARLFRTQAANLRGHAEELLVEHFGPVAIVVEYDGERDLFAALEAVPGSLTFSVQLSSPADSLAAALVAHGTKHAGRFIVNGWPTGVAVRQAMHHGGPYPSSTTPASTSVGSRALERFVAPVCYQNVPDDLLPPPLQDANPWRLPRRVNGLVTTDPIQGREARR